MTNLLVGDHQVVVVHVDEVAVVDVDEGVLEGQGGATVIQSRED